MKALISSMNKLKEVSTMSNWSRNGNRQCLKFRGNTSRHFSSTYFVAKMPRSHPNLRILQDLKIEINLIGLKIAELF